MAKTILLLGATGQVGQALLSQWPEHYLALTPSHQALDFLTPASLTHYIDHSAPDLVINCVAYNQVDNAEREQPIAQRINALAVQELAAACKSQQIPLLHFSTDYVFPGKPAGLDQRRYVETDTPQPINVYGLSKYQGEQAVLGRAENMVLRVSWVFSEFARNMGQHIVSRCLAGKSLKLATDQFGSPTYAGHIADVVWALVPEMLAGAKGGLYHLSGNEAVSRFQLAQAIVDELHNQKRLPADYALGTTTQAQWLQAATATVAPRPGYSALGCDALAKRLGRPVTSWREGLSTLVAASANVLE